MKGKEASKFTYFHIPHMIDCITACHGGNHIEMERKEQRIKNLRPMSLSYNEQNTQKHAKVLQKGTLFPAEIVGSYVSPTINITKHWKGLNFLNFTLFPELTNFIS